MRIALYGGSFNPPHLGHVEAARAVYDALEPDIFYIVPDNIPPHKEMEPGSPDAGARLEMARLAFQDIRGAVVSDMELRREGKSYTVDTLTELGRLHPDAELYLVVGTDMFLSFRQWYMYQTILGRCSLAVLSREEDDGEEIRRFGAELEAECGASVTVIANQPLPMSSSDIRERLRRGSGAALLPESVYAYIIRHRCYDAQPELTWLREKVYARLKGHRIAHTAGCESEAVALARRWGEDPETAAVAAILHDVTKNLSDEKQLLLCEKYGIMLDIAEKRNPKLLHARTGAAVARDEFGVSDEIYEAIRWHTTGKPDMTLLEKLIYLADYIEPTRDFPGVEELRQLAFMDLDRAMARGLEMSLREIREKGLEPFRDSVDAARWYGAKEEDKVK